MDGPSVSSNQLVKVRAPYGGWRNCLGDFVVVSTAPTEGCETLYLIRCVSDGHERVVIDSEIRPAASRFAEATLNDP